MNLKNKLLLIFVLTFISALIAIPEKFAIDTNIAGKQIKFDYIKPPVNFELTDTIKVQRDLALKKGLDIAGGLQVQLKLDFAGMSESEYASAVESTREVIARRVDQFGVGEPNIYTQQNGNDYRLVVELPGLSDPQKAIELIGQTARLEFKAAIYEQASESAEPIIKDFLPAALSGADLQKAAITFQTNDGKPAVQLKFNDEGAKKFAALTKDNLGKPIAIFLDDQIVTAPIVQTEITTGDAIITGDYSVDSAKQLAIQLNAGALPVKINIETQNQIAPTLGDESIALAIKGGLIGLFLVVTFMVLVYGRFGLVSLIGLVIYALTSLALYKLFQITLTLPGIAGFILSIGMAVDSNILIFERFKEEKRLGKPSALAMEQAFGRAWDSIKDANITTLITAFILFNPLNWSFLPTSGPVRGFALTLVLGIVISLYTGIFVTRTMLRLLMQLTTKTK
jgi:preprotein translocase subunit SecD